MNASTWIKKNTASLTGKTVAISGATGGLGRELCFHLASLGADLILLDRNPSKSKALAEEIGERFPSISISRIRVDMTEMASVKAAAEELLGLFVDVLVLNAGAYSIPRCRCDTGYDNVFQINFIAPYYLARTLLPHLRTRGGRVIAVGSIAHRYSKSDARDVDFSTRRRAGLVYGNAKRYLMLSLFGLAQGEGEIGVVHPGITLTNITAHYPKWIFALIKHPMKVLFPSPRRASLCILCGLFEDCGDGEWIGPRFFDVWGSPKKKPLRSYEQEEADRICRVADGIYESIRNGSDGEQSPE